MSADTPIRRSANTNRSMTEYIKQREGRAIAIFYNSAELSDPDGKQVNRPRRFTSSSARVSLQTGRTTQISLTAQTELAATNPQFAIVRNSQIYPIRSSTSSAIQMDPTFDSLTITNAFGTNNSYIVKYNTLGGLNWARKIAGGINLVRSVFTDNDKNIYVTGQYRATTTINFFDSDNTTVFTSLSASDTNQGFVAKYNSSGKPQWVRRIGGNNQVYGYAITVDVNSNIYVSCLFLANLTVFDSNNTTTFLNVVGNSSGQICLIKYDINGVPQWVRMLGGGAQETPQALATDSAGSCYVLINGDNASGTMTVFDTDNSTIISSMTMNTQGGNESYIVKYNSSGTPQWARKIGGLQNDFGNGISTDSLGNIYVSGRGDSSSGGLNFYASDHTTAALSLISGGGNQGFLVKYNNSGTPQWAQKITGDNQNYAFDNCTDSEGNIYVLGNTNSSTLRVLDTNNSTILFSWNNTGSYEGFIIKYSPSGKALWLRVIAGGGSEYPTYISSDSNGNIYVSGYGNNTINIYNSDNSTIFNSIPGYNFFLIKYDKNGNPQWARIVNSSENATDTDGNIIVCGYSSAETITFLGS